MKDESETGTGSCSSFILHPSSFVPKVADFGLAKFLTGSNLTRTGDALGTPSYMAPEQTAGKSGLITAAADVYGLGAILYETLTGRPPFRAETLEATLVQVLEEDPVPPRRLQPTVPLDLDTICMKCLRKEAGRRYATAQELADDLRRFRAGEAIRARPVGAGERVVRWCRRQPVVAGLLAALVIVSLAGLSGVLWEWQLARHHAAEAEQNAAAFEHERDAARREQARAERHLRLARGRADRLTQVGRELWANSTLYPRGREVLEEALTYYQEILPEEGSDPGLRLEAARLYFQVAEIHHGMGRWDKAVEAYEQQGRLLAGALAAEPGNKQLRRQLAHSHRWRGNALRDLRKTREARAAYDQAAALQEQLLRESPSDTDYQVALANTLLNTATLLSPRSQAEELRRLYRRSVELDRAAVAAKPENLSYQAELALGLGDQGMFLLDIERVAPAADALREAVAINQKLLAGDRMGRSYERYVARTYGNLGRVLVSAGQPQEAEQSHREALKLLDQLVTDFPHTPYYRSELAETLESLASLLTEPGRRPEVEELRRNVVRHYEILTANFREDRGNQPKLLHSYLLLGDVLVELGQCAQAAEQYRKALKLDPESPVANNGLAWFLATNPEPSLRDAAEAVRRAEKAVKAEPKSGSYRNTLGVAHYRNGDYKGALADLEESMRLRDGGDSFDWFFVAMTHWHLGDRAKARLWFDRAVQWMDRHKPQHHELRRFCTEVEALLAEVAP
jgi:tetratricopeptide (TPR) repeat protein